MATSVIPQSRSEQILAATINGEEYNQPPQSRIEQLLIELKEAVEEGGGGGGTTVVANPSGEATDELVKIKIGSTIYSIEGGAPGISFDKIWENPAPEDSIGATDITIPSVAAYEKFLMIYKCHKMEEYPKFSSVIFKKGCPGVGFMISVSSGKINLGLRDFSIANDTTFHVGTCRVAQHSLDASVNTAYCIPYILYGINETAGGGSGVSLNYNQLINRPVVNEHTLEGNKTGSDYGLVDNADSFTAAQKAALLALLD